MTNSSRQPNANGKPFLGLHLRCCNVYTRIYINAQKDAFAGWCPRCARPVRVEISNDGSGSNSRMFSAG
ncbi:hypothetical protein [Thalassoroseus pseudoceratinae]|uniref:hypothetical protein n=1 Tax=Thalassoroseus pseudoceratinae TaxID=2713176 RepID=UPI00142056CD|nr:hypothetical protein [Thalassoroseus pseudoceratinae]